MTPLQLEAAANARGKQAVTLAAARRLDALTPPAPGALT